MMETASDGYEIITVKDGYSICIYNYIETPDGYGIIYRATSPSGKVYIGQTAKGIKERIKRHYVVATNVNTSAHRQKIYCAIRKYKDKIRWECLYAVQITYLDEVEISEIDRHDSFKKGYNLTIGGSGVRGHKRARTKEEREHLSKIRMGKSNPFYGKTHSKDLKDRMAKKLKGIRPKMTPEKELEGRLKAAKMASERVGEKHPGWGKNRSDETKSKISKTRLERHIVVSHSEEAKRNMAISRGSKTIIVYKDGNVVGRFYGIRNCERETGISRKTIRKYIKSGKEFDGYWFKLEEVGINGQDT